MASFHRLSTSLLANFQILMFPTEVRHLASFHVLAYRSMLGTVRLGLVRVRVREGLGQQLGRVAVLGLGISKVWLKHARVRTAAG